MDANITLKQIGIGNLMACGARDFVTSATELSFRVGSKRGKLEKILVTLDPSDTYSVRYVRLQARSYVFEADETISDVYADNLGAVVRRMGDR